MPDVYEEDGAGSTPHTAHRAWKKITCSINFRKQWPNLPFFSEKEQVIFFRRLGFSRKHCLEEFLCWIPSESVNNSRLNGCAANPAAPG